MVVAGVLALSAGVVTAETPSAQAVAGTLTLGDGAAKAMPPGAKVGGGGLSIRNAGPDDDRLVKVESSAAGRVELHEMTMDNDVMRMRKLDAVDLPAGKTVTLSGDLHLMFMDVKAPFRQGDSIPLTLTFAKAGQVSYSLRVGSVSGK
jgi:copper(I)-binding protein